APARSPYAPAAPAGPPTLPGGPPTEAAVRLVKGEEWLPVDMRKRLSLRKQQVAVSLSKAGATGVTARVILVLDASGSMSALYSRGTVANVVERMAAVAAQLDDDGEMQAWTFATNPARLPDLAVGDLPDWLRLHVRVGQMSLFGRKKPPRGLQPGQVDMRAVGFQNEEQKVIAEVRAYARTQSPSVPTLVLFFSDGGVYRNDEIERELRAAVDEPVFWQFVGLGRAGFGVLERFDTMAGRRVDNVGFFAVDDIDKVSDPELYDRLLSEFPSWLRAARQAGILR
ncbi:vWA domain-containing protein, partial [Streptomyces sp. NPDC059985]